MQQCKKQNNTTDSGLSILVINGYFYSVSISKHRLEQIRLLCSFSCNVNIFNRLLNRMGCMVNNQPQKQNKQITEAVMKLFFKFLRFIAMYLISGIVLYLIGYGRLMDDISPDDATRIFLLSALVIAIIISLITEMFIFAKARINELSNRISELEDENNNK